MAARKTAAKTAKVREETQNRTFVVATNRDGVNLREKPDMKAKVIAFIPNGERVEENPDAVTAPGWTAVTGGYVMTKYLV